MNLHFVILAIVAIAIASVYILQWLKNGPFKIPSVVAWILSPILNMALALAAVVGIDLGIPFLGFLILGAMGWALSQAAYEVLLKHVPVILENYASTLESKVTGMKAANALGRLPSPSQ